MSAPYRIEHVDRLDCTVEPWRWAWADENAELIDARWDAAVALKPRMFNGPILLAHEAKVEQRGGERVFAARFFVTGYKNLYVSQQLGFPDQSAANCFAMAALRSSDGAFLLGEMGPHTANAGQIYSPAGTPDLDDVVDNTLDLPGSVLREMEEETGLSPSDVRVAPGSIVIFRGAQIACMSICELNMDAATANARISQWLATQDQPELSRMHIIRSTAELKADRMPAFMAIFLEYMLKG